MEQGLKLWKQLFGRVREVDFEEFSEIFHDFVKQYGDCDLDEYQMRYIRELIDPDRQFRVTISDFLIFFTSFWNIPSKRISIFSYMFKINEENSNQSHNDVDHVTFQIQNKYEKSPIKYLCTGSTIDIYRDHIVLNGEVKQELNKLDVLRIGSDAKAGQNDIVLPDTLEVSPIHGKIGIGNTGYYIKDQSKKINRMRFILGDKKPLVLDYKIVFEIGSSGCKFWVKKIYPEPIFDALNTNFVNYVFTGQHSLERELQDFQSRSQKKHFHNVKEWREDSIQIKRSQNLYEATNDQPKDPNKDYYIEIECFEGELKGKSFLVNGAGNQLRFGRDKLSEVHIKHVSAAQNHALIQYNRTYGSWIIRENQKTLGTYVYMANYDQYIGNSNSNFHLIQSDLPFELYNYIFYPKLQYKASYDL